jgi:hypothetical protein
LRIFDLPPDVLEARSLGNASELAMEGIAAAADTVSPALAVQVCPLLQHAQQASLKVPS